MASRLVLAALLVPLWCPPADAGPRLDDLLNAPFLDAHSPKRDESRHATVEPGSSVGQTFVTGPEVECVFEIAVWQAFWHETWQPDESLVMTLWNGPEKRVALGRCAIPYARRMWEQAVPIFHLDARVAPSHAYYFELTVETEPLRPAEIPREWVLAGKRPGFADGDGRLVGIGIAKEDYPPGQAFVGGQPQDFDLWFAIHARRPIDRDALYSEAFGRFDLDYPKLRRVKAAVRKRDWDVAVDALIAHFESRPDLIPPDRERPIFDPAFDTREADLAAEHKVPLPDGATVDLGPQWSHYTLWPEQGGVGLTRGGLRKPLAAGYQHTGNEKYARAFDDMLAHLFVEHPSPIRAGVYGPDEQIPAALPTGLAGGSMWSGLSIAARMGHGFAYYRRFLDSPYFTHDVRAAFIINLGEMAEVLERQKGGGNWETQMANSLFDFGLTYPEFKGARRWAEQGFGTVVQNALSTVRPDGCLQEPTINYHAFVMGMYVGVIERARALKLPIPDEMLRLVEKMHEYVMYSALPDGSLPLWGDANPPTTPDALKGAAALFSRDDFRFVGTRGKEGKPPEKTSIGFPDGGFYYMRSGWEPDAQYMAIRCGPHGSHGHSDPLSLIVSAFGRLTLIDPGVYIYGTPECAELSRTRSHNTVTVDDADVAGAECDAWVTSERFSYFAGHHGALKGVRHDRRVWFLKPFATHPALWLVLDDVTGEGEHTAALRYRFAPGSVASDAEDLSVQTTGDGPGLLIRVAPQGATKLSVGEGIAAASWEALTNVPTAAFEQRGPLPMTFSSLLVPFATAPPANTHIETLPGARAVWVVVGDEAVVALTSDGAVPVSVALPDGRSLSATAAALAICFTRSTDGWRRASLHGVRVQSASLAGEKLFAAEAPQEVVDWPIP
ncbi:MAG: hypothetical protein FJX75_22480 [Armatimonadetes bacterium]|nr:hypothetical protein [Armatimonadota bacterium]